MQEVNGLVSIVIPAYNAQQWLPETLNSVKEQTYIDWEIIIVNDGSSDGTPKIIANETDPRVSSIEQQNSGVSAARNRGLEGAKGEFIVFLDADDILSSDFLQVRISFLRKDISFGYVGGMVQTFPVPGELKKAAAEIPEQEILFFNAAYSTVPSNYMFRTTILRKSGIRWNKSLSSTADRFFVLEISKYTKGKSLVSQGGILYYRVNEKSMSHRVSPELIRDNEKFYHEIVNQNLLPAENIGQFKCLYFYSLGLGFAKIHFFALFAKYELLAFLASPGHFLRLVGAKLQLSKKKII